jgi:hypothetical protein
MLPNVRLFVVGILAIAGVKECLRPPADAVLPVKPHHKSQAAARALQRHAFLDSTLGHQGKHRIDDMSFQFVDSSNVDPAARRRIRQQAAKGRNAGRPVLRARKSAQTIADRPRPGSLLEKEAMSGWKPKHRKIAPDQLMMMSIERPVTLDMGTVTLPSYFGRGVDVTQRGTW